MNKKIILAQKPTIHIEVTESFLISLMRLLEIADLTAIILLYKNAIVDKSKIESNTAFYHENTIITYTLKNGVLYLENIEQFRPNINKFSIQYSEHYVAKLIRNKASILSFIPAYFYALQQGYFLNSQETKMELTVGNETILFSVKEKNLKLITGWIGNRTKRQIDVF